MEHLEEQQDFTNNGGGYMQEIIIRKSRMLLVLYENEIVELLKKNPTMWAQAIKRGKSLNRLEKSMSRKG